MSASTRPPETLCSPTPNPHSGPTYELARAAMEFLTQYMQSENGGSVIRAVQIVSVGWDKITAYAAGQDLNGACFSFSCPASFGLSFVAP